MTENTEAPAAANSGRGTEGAVVDNDTPTLPPPRAEENPPAELTALKRWIPWRFDDGNKVPLVRWASPETWSSYEDARARAPRNGGVGLVFNGDGLGGIDLDACRDPGTGALAAWAWELIADFSSYAEVSPSGTGVKIFARGAMPTLPRHVLPMPGEPLHGKRPQVEAYVDSRFFTVTGAKLPDAPSEVRESPGAWLRLHQRLAAAEQGVSASNLAEQGRNGALFSFGRKLRALTVPDRVIRACLHAANRAADPALHPSFATKGALPTSEVEATCRSVLRKPGGPSDAAADAWARDAQDAAFAAWVGAR